MTTIAGLARAGGVGVETVRYGPEDVRRLHFIRSAQGAGFTLDQIGELLALDATADRARARDLAREQLAVLDARIAELQRARAALDRLSQACAHGDAGPCPIIAAFDGAPVET